MNRRKKIGKDEMGRGLLAGVRVLTFGWAGAAPYGTQFMGDLGAEIINVESSLGDPTRTASEPSYKGESGFYMTFSRNKKSLKLDIQTESGKKAFLDLVRISDVVVENFRPGVMTPR